MIISGLFSLVIYRLLTIEVDRFLSIQRVRIERQMQNRVLPIPGFEPQVLIDPDLVADIKTRLFFSLLTINGIILLVSGILGYLLAGRTLRPIEESHNEQKRFVADASHELRTPLTAIKTEIEVNLRDKNLSLVDAKTCLKSNLEEIEKLKNLTNNLLLLSKGQSLDVINIQKINLEEIFEELSSRFSLLLKNKEQKLITNIDKNNFVQTDKDILIEILSAFIENASKYSSTNKNIYLKTKRKGRNVSITVQDEGIGINSSDLPHIFDRFYRTDASRNKNKVEGFGLGLSIAKNLSRKINGSIQVKSSPNKGSSFSLVIPINPQLNLRISS